MLHYVVPDMLLTFLSSLFRSLFLFHSHTHFLFLSPTHFLPFPISCDSQGRELPGCDSSYRAHYHGDGKTQRAATHSGTSG